MADPKGGTRAADPLGFFAQNKCPRVSAHPPVELIKADTLVPYIKIQFKNANTWITVGNRSSNKSDAGCTKGVGGLTGGGASNTKENHASITHFQYGCSGGTNHGSDGVVVEITDEEGGDFCNFITNILPISKDKDKMAENCVMIFQFGWIAEDCLGANLRYFVSRPRQCFPLTCDVAFQGGGVIKYTIHAPHPAEVVASGPNSNQTDKDSTGGDINKKDVKKSIIEKFNQYNMDVEFFAARNPNGPGNCTSGSAPAGFLAASACPNLSPNYDTWEFLDGQEWPGKWPDNNKDPLSAVQELLKDKVTKNKRHFIFGTCNAISNRPKFIIWESPLPDCKGKGPELPNIGTFIVNGGQCSNVLEFRPQIQWIISNLNQGGGLGNTGGVAQVAGSKSPTSGDMKEYTCDVSGEGTPVKIIPDVNMTNLYPKLDLVKTSEAYAAAARALPPIVPIKAELVIQGWECLDDPLAVCGGMECEIIVVNPYYLDLKGFWVQGERKDWLAKPGFNAFLTQKNWFINGVSHEIKEGSFTTTLSVVFLGSPALIDDASAITNIKSGGV